MRLAVFSRARRERVAVLFAAVLAACAGAATTPSSNSSRGTPVVGPTTGTLLVVGGGAQGPELYKAFIDGAGGPEALIVDIPTAGGDTTYPADWRGANGLKAGGAKNVVILHSNPNRKNLANSDSFVSILRRAGGVWFEGGRQFRLVDSYGGTRTETEIMNVLRRGGIVGGSSAGASIMGSFMVRGAPSNNNAIMEYPGYTRGFGYLRNTGVDQHVVARMRLPDLADSLVPRHPDMLFISADEGTAWHVRGDHAEIIGRNKAFVYDGADPNDPGKPFLTLLPGDRYDLGRRRVISRAIDRTPLTNAFLDSVFAGVNGRVTVHVAQEGNVLAARGYGVGPQERHMPVTATPNFAVGGVGDPLIAAVALGLARDGRLTLDDVISQGGSATIRDVLTYANAAPDGMRKIARLLIQRAGGGTLNELVQRRALAQVGNQRLRVNDDGEVSANVDDLYRWELGLQAYAAVSVAGADSMFAPGAGRGRGNGLGWRLDQYRGLQRQAAYATPDGRGAAHVRIPAYRASVIIASDVPSFDARRAAERIVDRLLFSGRDSVRFRAAVVPGAPSCRSMSAASPLVAWAGCTGGRVLRTTDGGTTWRVDTVRGAETLDFRGIKAFDAASAVVVSAGEAERGQARIYRTADSGRTWSLSFSDTTRGVFLDGVAFWDARNGFTFSDPVGGKFVILTTGDGGRTWQRVPPDGIPPALPGEAAFAASNTQLAVQGSSNAWIATGGGPEARVFRTSDRGRTWSVASTGIPAGPSSGFFGIAFADARNGLAIGGDYRSERGVAAFALRTADGGVTWTRVGRPDGTTSGLAAVPGMPGRFVAVGQFGVSATSDFGASWYWADTLTTHAVSFAGPAGFVAGPRGRLAVLARAIP